MTATQRAVVDDLGNINVHGRSALEIVWQVKDRDGNLLDLSASDLFVEIDTKLRIALVAGADNYSPKLRLTRAQVASLPLNKPLDYALHDETPSSPATIWSGKITAYGFRNAPAGADAVEGGAVSWTGATVTVQQGESVPTVVVTYMGATGGGVPTGGTAGQLPFKNSGTNYDLVWRNAVIGDVTGLQAALDAKQGLHANLTAFSGLSLVADSLPYANGTGTLALATLTAAGRALLDDADPAAQRTTLGLGTAAVENLASMAAMTMAGVLAFLAGTAALPGLAVAGDLNTGIYGVSADVLGVTAGGSQVQTWGVGTSTLTGNLLMGADATYNVGAPAANRPANAYISNSVVIGASSPPEDVKLGMIGPFSNEKSSGGYLYSLAWQTNDPAIGFYAADGLLFGTVTSAVGGGWSEKARLTNAGNFGLGTTDITYRLDVKGSYQTIVSRFLRSADYGEVIRLGRDGVAGSAGIGYPADDTISLLTSGIERVRVSGAGHLLAGADATYDQGAVASGRFRDYYASRTVYAGTSVLIGGAAPAGAAGVAAVQAFGQSFAMVGGDVLTDATGKSMRIGVLHYTNSEEPVTLIHGLTAAADSLVNIGGGTSAGNAATQVNVYTAATITTVSGTKRWLWDSSGHYLAAADNTYDIGASGANRVRNLYVGWGVYSTNFVLTSGEGTIRGFIYSAVDGIIGLYNAAGTGFTGIKLGGATSAFPYIKVSGANLQGRLADDTDFNHIQAKLQTHANAVAETPTATHTLTLYDASGTAYRVLALV